MGSPEISLTTLTQYTAYDHAKATADCIAMASVRAPPCKTQLRSPVDIVAVIDRSGSMEGEKLDLVKKTLLFVIDQLKPTDRLSLVLYDDLVNVEFSLTRMTAENKKVAKSKVEKIIPRGFTNLCDGLLKGMEQIIVRDDKQKAMVASVLLFTDGMANHGICSCKEIIIAMRDPIGSLAKSATLFFPSFLKLLPTIPEPVEDVALRTVNFEGTIYTFGFGSEHSGDLLTSISNAANGVYYFIDSKEKIAEYFADCLGGLLSVVGQNMTLTIEAEPCCTLGTVHYKNKPQMEPDSKRCVVPLGDLQSEEERDIIIPIKLETLEAECLAQPLIKVTLSYLNVITTLMQTTTVNLSVDRKSVANLEPNEAVSAHLCRIQAALTLQEVKQTVSSNPQHAKTMLKTSMKLIESAAGATQNKALVTDLHNVIESLDLSDKQSSLNGLASFEQESLGQRRNSSIRHSSCRYDTDARCLMRINSLDTSMK